MKKSPPLIPEEYQECWQAWLYYKLVQHKFKYKDPSFEYIGFKKLLMLSGNKPDVAMEIVEQSIASGWTGLHPLKNNNNASTKNHHSGSTTGLVPSGKSAGGF